MNPDLRPSSLSRTVKCPAWLLTVGCVPNTPTSTSAADEGTAAHEVLHRALVGLTQFEIGKRTAIGVPVTQDMIEYANEFKRRLGHVNLFSELKIDCSCIYAGMTGTADVVIHDTASRLLHIMDYKYGFAWVSPVDNYQLLAYCMGFWDSLGRPGGYTFMLSIYQPRAYHADGVVRSVTLDSKALVDYFAQMRQACETAMTPNNNEYHVGAHCLYCPRRHVCGTLSAATDNIYEWLNQPQSAIDTQPSGQSTELSMMASAEILLKAKRTALELVIMEGIKSGKSGYRHMIKQAAGRLQWAIPIDQVTTIGNMFGVELTHPEPITPTQALKLGVPVGIIQDASERLPGAVSLKEIKETTLKNMFSAVSLPR